MRIFCKFLHYEDGIVRSYEPKKIKTIESDRAENNADASRCVMAIFRLWNEPKLIICKEPKLVEQCCCVLPGSSYQTIA